MLTPDTHNRVNVKKHTKINLNLNKHANLRTVHMCNQLIDWLSYVKVWRSTQHKTGHFGNTFSHVCAYHCTQLSYTTQHETVLIIFPVLSSRQSSQLRCCVLDWREYSVRCSPASRPWLRQRAFPAAWEDVAASPAVAVARHSAQPTHLSASVSPSHTQAHLYA